ncbi:amino acid adenylation domain-containing protein [Solwaraspora sp. WMMB335]|uniref:amino acid adenylation domain-containing protein n=1 Tax=Solwaraspora sp. WMMB335 TaxID=3404118 RepID=UPI003B93D68C
MPRRRAGRSLTLHRSSATAQHSIPRIAGAGLPPDPLARLSGTDRQLFRRFGYGPDEPIIHTHIHHAFERWAAAVPDAVAVEHLGVTITYHELDRQADQLARRLVSLGVRPGDRVGLFLRRSIPMIIGLLATLKAGAAYVPQHVGVATDAQLRHVLHTAAIRVVLTTSEFAGQIPQPAGQVVLAVDETLAEPPATESVPAGPVSSDDGCYVLFTSGTTGQPNGVTVTHRNVCNLLLTAPGDLGIRPGWRVGQILSIAFDMAAWEILGCLSHGGTLVVRGRDIAATVEQVDVVIATPSVLGTVDPDRCARVKVVAVAGEPCPRPLADRWARHAVFHNSCGPTETTIVNTMQRHDPAAAQLTIGRPTPNNTVYVLDADRQPCPIGEVGEMWAGGDCVSAGYLGNPELTGQRYAPDPFLGGGRMMFRTRDLGRWTSDGELEHLGRTDDQVKVRGFRVELDSVSAVLESVPGCRRAATLKVDDRTLVSFVAPGVVDPQVARQAVADALPYYCVPDQVHALPVLPMTDRGKIDKAALRRLLDRPATSGPVPSIDRPVGSDAATLSEAA